MHTVVPKYGSVYTFSPSEGMGVKQSITMHRSHKSQIEGHKLLAFSQRLKRVYGWEERTFEVSEEMEFQDLGLELF